MKIAVINSVCGYGSTGKIALNNYKLFKSLGVEAKVYYGIYKQTGLPEDIVFFGSRIATYLHIIIGRIFGLSGMLSNLPTSRLLRELRKFTPDIVWLGNLHGYYINEFRLMRYLKKSECYVVYSMPDEYAFLGKCTNTYNCEKYKVKCEKCPHLRDYPKSLFFDNSSLLFDKKKKVYDGFDRIIFRSAPYIIERAKESALIRDKQLLAVDSTVDVRSLYYPRNPDRLRKQLNIPNGAIVVLNCAPYSSVIKGVRYFLAAARLLDEDNIIFINIGFDGDKNECPANYIAVPYVSNPDVLTEYYSLADAYVCTSIADAMPNTCLEALGCGTPILGFNISGVPYVADKEHGSFIEPVDENNLAQAIKEIPQKTASMIKSCHEYAMARYDLAISNASMSKLIDHLPQRIKVGKEK